MTKVKQFIKKTFLYSIYTSTRDIIESLRVSVPILIEKISHPESVFLVLTPIHGNLGDHAIAYSAQELLRKMNIRVFEIPGKKMFILEKHYLLKILNNTKIIVTGGGFLGTLWYHNERVIRNLIDSTPDSCIFFFPNTIFYDDTDFGICEYEKAKEFYSRVNVYKLYAREKYSYHKMLEIAKSVGLVPDIVMRLKFDEQTRKRSGCMLLMRDDVEKTIATRDYEILYNQIKKEFSNRIKDKSTVTSYPITIRQREKELLHFFEQIKTAELVVTDRLHGMIFAAITGTACIVINSKSPKVLGCYEWIKHLDYVKICSDVNDFTKIYHSIPKENHRYQNESIMEKFDTMCKDIEDFVGMRGTK